MNQYLFTSGLGPALNHIKASTSSYSLAHTADVSLHCLQETVPASKSCLPCALLVPAMWEPERHHRGPSQRSSLRAVMGRSHRGDPPWVCVLRENRQEQKREQRDSNEWAIVREIEAHLYGLLCHWKWEKWKHISPLTAAVDLTPLSWAAYDVVQRRGGPRGCPRGLLFLVRD